MMLPLSILICTIPSRQAEFVALRAELMRQMAIVGGGLFEVRADFDPLLTVGAKRNRLLADAVGEYVDVRLFGRRE